MREEALDAWKTCLKYNPKQKYARENLNEFTNEYEAVNSPVGMDDYNSPEEVTNGLGLASVSAINFDTEKPLCHYCYYNYHIDLHYHVFL